VTRRGFAALRHARIDRISERGRGAIPTRVVATESEMFLSHEPTAVLDLAARRAIPRLPRMAAIGATIPMPRAGIQPGPRPAR
jgi:hypothetical protein